MRVKTIICLLTLFVASLLAALPLAGCGSSGAVFTDSAALFQQAKEEVGAADSFRETGEMTISMSMGSEDIEMVISMDIIFERQDDGKWIARMDMVMDLGEMMGGSGPGSRMKVEAYIVDGKMYMKMPGMDMWVCQEQDELQELSGMGSGMSPDGLSRMMESAKEAELLEEGPDTVKYRLVLDEDKVFPPEVEEELRRGMAKEGRDAEYVDEVLQSARGMLSGMEMTVTADKRTGLIVEITMQADDFLGSAGGLLAGSGLGDSGASFYAAFTISDYGKDFGIELPEEALDALPMEEMLEEQLL